MRTLSFRPALTMRGRTFKGLRGEVDVFPYEGVAPKPDPAHVLED